MDKYGHKKDKAERVTVQRHHPFGFKAAKLMETKVHGAIFI